MHFSKNISSPSKDPLTTPVSALLPSRSDFLSLRVSRQTMKNTKHQQKPRKRARTGNTEVHVCSYTDNRYRCEESIRWGFLCAEPTFSHQIFALSITQYGSTWWHDNIYTLNTDNDVNGLKAICLKDQLKRLILQKKSVMLTFHENDRNINRT